MGRSFDSARPLPREPAQNGISFAFLGFHSTDRRDQTVENCEEHGAGGGNRTRTTRQSPRILSPVRLPVSPPRRACSPVLITESFEHFTNEPRLTFSNPS